MSFGYLLVDLLGVVLLWSLALHIPQLPLALRYLAWPAYWIVQGCVMTGIWVIGHECGHGGFSASDTVNNWTGLVTHSALLVPFYSWKISHGHHHSCTGDVDNDEVFVPALRSTDAAAEEAPIPLMSAIWIVVTLTIGWFGYLSMNVTGPAKYEGKARSHFNPASALFNDGQRHLVLISDLGVLAALSALAYGCYVYGTQFIVFMYIIPYLNVNFWLVLITYLQHTDPLLPHYKAPHWTWLGGALATVDRDYGILNIFHHHIADTHVCHHLFSKIPHYHAQEATEALKPILGSYYKVDNTPIVPALWRSFRECLVVDDTTNQGPLWWCSSATKAKAA
jgi:omega-6 fatty acid desaturase (delta-12 desaturase)